MSKTSPAFAPIKPSFVTVGIAITAIACWYSVNVSQLQPLNEIGEVTKTQIKETQKSSTTVAVPEGWRTENLAEGVTAYTLPAQYKTELEYDAVNNVDTLDLRLDGTRYPYVSDISQSDLTQDPHHPNHYFWKGVWQGEGYNRVLDRNHQLVAERENSVDIHLSISLDTSVTDATKPNLIITVKSDQDETAQLTNISAFRIDSETGKTLDRRDFAQLPPVYEVTASRNGGYAGTEIKALEPLGTVTFAYHVSAEQVQQNLPIRLTAVNRLFTERQQEIYDLQAKGWVVKEVPAPSY
ncbi:MAG: hypothetical protein KME11_12290 [Timaviella obliquedivisa GSE-PSE-MK23-08B]|jgi:hypothetical protein|nr:hypothetical protein [Timaviella obliquedivisa GSE-PSE-MK23-08B]